MQHGEMLYPDHSLTSANRQYTLTCQGDGNLVLYRNRDGRSLWASLTAGHRIRSCVMQDDGNLVVLP